MADKPQADYYTGPQAGDFAEANEPFALFEAWFAEAQAHEPNDANAMALASVDASGMPNVRNSSFETAANVPGTTVAIIGGAAGQAAQKAAVYTTN